ncbi:MAG: transposase [Candidatus Njordarchaeia archaeon]
MRKKKNTPLIEINPLEFVSEDICAQLLREIRWKNHISCPHCGSLNIRRRGKYGPYLKYECASCGRIFNDKTGTIFYRSHLPIKFWCAALILDELNYSILRISKILDISYDSAYRMIQKIRKKDDNILMELKDRLKDYVDYSFLKPVEEEEKEEIIDVSDVEVPREAVNFMLELIEIDLENRRKAEEKACHE